MRRILGILAAGAMVLSTFAVSSFMPVTHATEFWCEDDPIVQINGVTININIGVLPGAAGHITNVIPVVVVIPDGAKAKGAGYSTASFKNSLGVSINAGVFVWFVEQSDANSGRSIIPGSLASAMPSTDSKGQFTVISMVPGDGTSFATRLSTSMSSTTSTSTSNHAMSVSFSLSDGNHGQHGANNSD